jgi:hypothetical protein
VRSHYDASTWLDVSRQLSDPIREPSRDALVAFLLKRERLEHADQLFSLYLIDTGEGDGFSNRRMFQDPRKRLPIP